MRISIFVTALALFTIAIFSLSGCSSNNISLPRATSTYARVVHSGKLRCAYIVYPPVCIKDPSTGKLSGIAIEALELVAKKLGLSIVWVEEVGPGTMIQGLQS